MSIRLSTVRLKRGLLITLLLVGCVGCDQLTKEVAQQYLAFESPQSWFHGIVRLEYAENRGAFLSLGSGFSEELRVILFQVFPALWLVGLAIVLFVAKQMPPRSAAAWGLVLSGGIGNLIDRLFHDGRVIDFMNIGIGRLRTGIFNVADVCITIGVSLFVLELLQRPRVSVNG